MYIIQITDGHRSYWYDKPGITGTYDKEKAHRFPDLEGARAVQDAMRVLFPDLLVTILQEFKGKFKPGDKVRVRLWEEMAVKYGHTAGGDIDIPGKTAFIKEMDEYCGTVQEVETVSNLGYRFKGLNFTWTDEMLEDESPMEVGAEDFAASSGEIDVILSRDGIKIGDTAFELSEMAEIKNRINDFQQQAIEAYIHGWEPPVIKFKLRV